MKCSRYPLGIITVVKEYEYKDLIRLRDSLLSNIFIPQWIIKFHVNSTPLDVKLFQYPNLKIVTSPDTGIYNAINQAVIALDSDYYIVSGSDDYFLSGSLDLLVKFFEENKDHDLICSNVLYREFIFAGSPNSKLWLTGATGRYGCHSIGLAFKSNLHSRYSFIYNENLKIYSDQDFLYKLSLAGISVIYSNLILGLFGDSGISSIKTYRSYKEYFLVQLHYSPWHLKPLQLFLFLVRICRWLINYKFAK